MMMNFKQLYSIALSICICIGITSCEKDFTESDANYKEIMGEWKAVKIEKHYNRGGVDTDTDKESISDNLGGYEWLLITENTFIAMERGCQLAYRYKNKRLKLEYKNIHTLVIKNLDKPIVLESISENEIIVKYEVDYGVLRITYNKLEPVDYADLLGQWEVDKFAATYNNGKKFSTFSDDVFENELKGLRRIELTEDTLTMIESKTLLPYTIENGNLVLSSSLSLKILSVKVEDDELNKLVFLYTSTQEDYTAVITYEEASFYYNYAY